jgi:hypothetical protein
MSEHSFTRRGLLLGGAAIGAGALGAGVLLSNPASASVNQPDIASCDEWAARPPSSPVTVLDNKPNKIIVHHTAMANSTDYSQAHAFANSRAIQDLHMDTNGWIDTGQQFTNSRGGWLTEGRHGSLGALLHGQTMVEGAQCVGQNDQSIGIENEGTYLDQQPPDALWNSLITLCAFVCQQYAIPATEIYGHKDFNDTQCPGLIHDRLPELRSSVATLLG